jgi:DNA-binding transcriptional MerR regulator
MEKFLLAGEAGKIAGCSAQNIVKLEKTGKLKAAFRTPTGVRLFAEHDIIELAAERRRREAKRN